MPLGWRCCCGTPCLLFFDPFAREDDTEAGNDWSDTEDDPWEILDEELKATAPSVYLTNAASVPSSPNGMRHSVRVKGENDGDQLQLAPSPFNNYVELTVGAAATLDLYLGSFLVRSCPVTAAAGEWHEIEITAGGTTATAGLEVRLNGALVMLGVGVWSYTVGGVGTGATLTASAYFDDFRVSLLRDINERQTILKSAGTITGGTWDIPSLPGGGSLSTIPYDVTAATLKTMLEGELGSGNVDAAGSLVGFGLGFTITFQGDLAATDLPLMVADGSDLEGTGTTLTVDELVKGYDCADARACPFTAGSKQGGWNSVHLVIASATDEGDTTGCAGLDGEYTLDEMEDGDCVGDNYFLSGSAECKCYGIDGLSIPISNEAFDGGSKTIQSMRFKNGDLILIDEEDHAMLLQPLYVSFPAGQNGPVCSDGTSFDADETNVTVDGLGCADTWTFTASDGG